MKTINALLLSENLLQKVKHGKSVADELLEIKRLSTKDLIDQLPNDDAKKVFWINIYNAFIQIDGNELTKNKKAFFKAKRVQMADLKLSFDDIEHGILRKGKYKYSLGYFNSLFLSAAIKSLQVKVLDSRIHFALNCGAKSCPPILFYKLDEIDNQLNLATSSFLEQSTTVNVLEKKVTVSRLFLFYLNDFGNKSGIKNLLKSSGLIDHTDFKIAFDQYDWSLKLNNFAKR